MNFEKREVTRQADDIEKADLVKRLLEVLSSIDQTKEEAKSAASEFNGIIKDLHKREIGLRFNLQTGTVTQEIEVHAMANETTGMMEYYDRQGIEVVELRHPMSEKQKEQEALHRQLNMFQEPVDAHKISNVSISTNTDKSVTPGKGLFSDKNSVTDDILNISPAGSVLDDTFDTLAAQGEIHLNEKLAITPTPTPVDTNHSIKDLPFEFTDEQPDIHDGINGAIAILTGHEQPMPKTSKKRNSQPATA